MDVLLLGPLEVHVEGHPIRIPGGRPREVFALLAVDAGRVVAARRLVELLWGDEEPPSAANALQVHISALRKALEPGGAPYRLLVNERSGYMLALGPDRIDSNRFERLFEQAHQALARGALGLSRQLLDDGLSLWRGSALAEFRDRRWAVAESRRLEEMRLTAEEDRLEIELADGRHVEAIPRLEALIARNPMRERLSGQLMLALYRAGRQADASDAYQRTRHALAEQLGMDPSRELQDLLKRILNQDPQLHLESRAPVISRGLGQADLTSAAATTTLVEPMSRFVGRESETDEVVNLLRRSDVPLITLTGAGGSGKSRLALRVAHAVAGDYPDGVWAVPLAAIDEPSRVLATIASKFDLREAPGRTYGDVLAEFLARRVLLLLLDNFEQLLPGGATVISELAAAAPTAKILVTSREPLRLTAEHTYKVGPMTAADAAELFAERASAVGIDLNQPVHAPEIEAICERLDRLPLALELAASRLRALSPAALLDRLDHRLPLLTTGSRDVPVRQQTLSATIAWSHSLLNQRERTLFARFAVFVRGCDLDAVQEVCDADIDTLSALIDKNLIVRRGDRYEMLETIREFALEQLEDSSEAAGLRYAHAIHYCKLAQAAEPELNRREQRQWLARLDSDDENLRAALRWLLASADGPKALQLACALILFWYTRGRVREGRESLLDALRVAPATSTEKRAWALDWAGYFSNEIGEGGRPLVMEAIDCARESGALAALALALSHSVTVDFGPSDGVSEAVAVMEEAVAVARKARDPFVLAVVLNNLGAVAARRGDSARASALLEESCQLREEMGDSPRIALSLANLGELATVTGDPTRGRALAQRGLVVADSVGDRRGMAANMQVLGWSDLASGQTAKSQEWFTESLRLSDAIGQKTMTCTAIICLAAIRAIRSAPLDAARLAGAVEHHISLGSLAVLPSQRALAERHLHAARAATTQDQWDSAWSAAKELSLAQLTAEILRPGSLVDDEPVIARPGNV